MRTDVFNRRPSNVENVHPSARASSSKIISGLRTTIQSASKRRRARATGGPSNPRYAAVQAKRKSLKTPAVKVTVVNDVKDVDMKDAEPEAAVAGSSTTQLSKPSTPILLPRYLARPEYREISRDSLVAIDPELAQVPMRYIQEAMESTGPLMMQVLSSVKTAPLKPHLPKDMRIMIDDLSSDLPTHMLAVHGRQTPQTPDPIRRVTLFPIHSIVLALYCANLPMLPKSTPIPSDTVGQLMVPIVPLCIPSPETWSQLSAYLYIKDAAQLLITLLPSSFLTPASIQTLEFDAESPEVAKFSAELRATYTAHTLLSHAMMINGLWRNVVALGVFDDQLWDVLDLAWGSVLGALEGGKTHPNCKVSNSKPEEAPSLPAAVDSSSIKM